jgi:Ca2+-binding RTX toxin-like protein
MRALYVRFDYTTFEAKPQAYNDFEHLSINGQTFSSRWGTVFDAGETWDGTINPYSPNTGYDYFEREIGSATFVNPGSQELATYTTFNGLKLYNWQTISVDDGFTIPSQYDNGLFGAFVETAWEDAKNAILIYLEAKGYSTAGYARLLNNSYNLYKALSTNFDTQFKLLEQVSTGQIDLATFEKNSAAAANNLLVTTTTSAFNIPSTLVEAVKRIGIQYSVQDPSFPNVTPYINATTSREMYGNLFQGQQNERFVGSLGNDKIDGLYGDDVVSAGPGNDTVFGFNGNDIYSGGPGIDTLTYESAKAPVSVSLAAGLASQDGFGFQDRFVGFENVFGGSAGDTITGDSRANILRGFGGNDLLAGGGGRDTLDGGIGIDTADFRDKTKSVAVVLSGDTYAPVTVGGVDEDRVRSIETVWGGSGNDSLTGDSRNNLLSGLSGNDILRGGPGDDSLFGDDGNDVLNGGPGNDFLFGGIIGLGGNDVLNGGPGNDVLNGGNQKDTLKGGLGDDTLIGGGDRDYLVFANGGGHDTVADFETGSQGDYLDLRGVSNLVSYQQLLQHTSQIGSNVEIDLTAVDHVLGDRLTLANVNIASLTPQNFIVN